MIYDKTVEAEFIDRPNRFLANVLIDGEEELVHVKNTGRCKEILIPGTRLILEDKSHIKTRKTKYSVIAAYKNNLLINIDSQVPNAVIEKALLDNKIEMLKDLDKLEREVTYKNSRFDLYFEKDNRKGFIEVKGVTLEDNGIVKFPDAPTSRGMKHSYEMMEALEDGYEAYIIFLIQIEGVDIFYLNWDTDPEFSQAIFEADKKGVNILAYDSYIDKNSISIKDRVKIDLKDYR